MNVYATQAIAEAHIAQRHREAEQHRRAHVVRRRRTDRGATLRRTWARARVTTAAWMNGTRAAVAEPAAPACCPA